MRTTLVLVAVLMAPPAIAVAEGLAAQCGDPVALAEKALGQNESVTQVDLDRRAGQAAVARADVLKAQLARGEPLDEPYGGAGRFSALAQKTSDPIKAELFRRVAMDLFARLHLIAAVEHKSWAEGLSPGALTYARTIVLNRDLCGLDQGNTAWLEKQLDTRGWFKRSTDGEDADTAAFLLVQHADLDKPFQKKVLAMLEPLLTTGDVRPQNYALLFDRVAVGEGRPQRYGSQGGCTAPGVWSEKPVEDAAALDKVRATVGLEPMAAYRARFKKGCGGEDK